MTGDVIKSFLVGLGFGVDDTSLAKFNKAIGSATLKVAALYGSINLMSGAVVTSLSKISEGFEQMGYEYRIIAPAINKALMLRQELLKAYSAAGINITKVIQSSVKLNFSLAKTRFAFEAIYRSVASRFFDMLTKQSDLFRQKIYANMPKIQAVLERMVKFLFKALEAVTALGVRLWSILTRVYDFFVTLDKATDGWSTRILAAAAAWKLLNLEFIATPLGLIITGLVAILALFDDFKTFQEGGKSLFNWGPAIPIIDSLAESLKELWKELNGIAEAVANVFLEFHQLFAGDPESKIGGIVNKVKDFFGGIFGGNASANLQNGSVPTASPVSAGAQNSHTNQNVQQQTNINVLGSADAGAVGKAVSSEQSKVNFDMVRNMKGATR